MKKLLMILSVLLLAFPAISAEEQPCEEELEQRDGSRKSELDGRKADKGKYRDHRRELTPEEKEQMQERRLEMMEKTMKNIGVTDEQKTQIIELQKNMKEEMRGIFIKVEENKKKLSELEKSGASEEEIFAAIDAVSDAQAEQMKVLARNRIQMERILGKEKFSLFMDSARNKWREHGRRGGSGMPPLPDSPPVPPTGKQQEPPRPVQMPPTP